MKTKEEILGQYSKSLNMAKAKRIENYWFLLLKDREFYISCINLDFPWHKYPDFHFALFGVKQFYDFLGDGKVLETPDLKPKGNRPKLYCKRGFEPKMDLMIPTSKGIFRTSIKKEASYTQTIGTREDFLSFFNIWREEIPQDLWDEIEDVADGIGYLSAYIFSEDQIRRYLGRNREKIEKARMNFDDFMKDFMTLYNSRKNKVLLPSGRILLYKDFLHEKEGKMQKLFKRLLNEFPDIFKKVVYEFATGFYNFGNENNSLSANIMASADHIFFFEPDKWDNPYTNMILSICSKDKKIGRLQNVPRKIENQKIFNSRDIEFIMNGLCRKQMSFKF